MDKISPYEGKIKVLPVELRKNGYDYTLVLRGERSCIYRQEVSANTYYFEVFLIKVRKEKEILGKLIPSKEVFPANEDFGRTAWTFKDLRKARWRFNELENSIQRLEFTKLNSDQKIYGG